MTLKAFVDEEADTPAYGLHTNRSPEFEDTGRIVASMLSASDKDGGKRAAEVVLTTFVHEMRKSGGGKPPVPPSKTYLGTDLKGWLGWLMKGALVVAVFLVTWYNTVNTELASKASHEDVASAVHEALGDHQVTGDHPEIDAELKHHATQLRLIHDSQIRQEGVDKVQTNVLKEIKEDIRYMRRRKR